MSKDGFAVFKEGSMRVLRSEGQNTSVSLQKGAKLKSLMRRYSSFDGTESS